MGRTRKNTGVPNKRKVFETTNGIGQKTVFEMAGNGSIANPFVVERSPATDTASFGKVQVSNDVNLRTPIVFGTVGNSATGTLELQASLSNRPTFLMNDGFGFTANNTELNFSFKTNFGGLLQNSSSIDCFIGNEGVTSTTGYQLSAGEVLDELLFNGDFFVTKTASGTCTVRSITA
tara:strand:- start:883 stop:1413 length:531 start_codon:yes stop_codon:yes gene_type:complete